MHTPIKVKKQKHTEKAHTYTRKLASRIVHMHTDQ